MNNQNNTPQNRQNDNETGLEKREPTHAERFTEKVSTEFAGAVGHGVEFTDFEKKLASNLFVHIDGALKTAESERVKRNQSNKPAVEWKNVNMQQLALDAVHIIHLGLDACIKNHVHVIPYLNGKTQQYDLDVSPGYVGKDYYRRKMAVEEIEDIRYELVHDTDEFTVIKKDNQQNIEEYEFKITQPFNRGKIVGGFGYIQFEDKSKNTLVLVSEEDFKKSEKAAPSNAFWGPWGDRMRYKTLVHRVTDKLNIDPEKVNVSYHYIEQKDDPFRLDPEKEIKQPKSERQKIDIDQDRPNAAQEALPDDGSKGNPGEGKPNFDQQDQDPEYESRKEQLQDNDHPFGQ